MRCLSATMPDSYVCFLQPDCDLTDIWPEGTTLKDMSLYYFTMFSFITQHTCRSFMKCRPHHIVSHTASHVWFESLSCLVRSVTFAFLHVSLCLPHVTFLPASMPCGRMQSDVQMRKNIGIKSVICDATN